MIKKVLLLIICWFLPLAAMADALKLKLNAPQSYIVKKGDTLWDISAIFLNQPWLWPKLWRLNPEISNPHLIYPGDKLRLVYDEQGQPMLVKGKPVLKWSPKIRTQFKDQSPVTTIPLQIIAPYIRYENVLSEEQLQLLPYIIGSDEGYKSSINGFKIYVNGELDIGKTYAIYRKGEVIIDPQSEEHLGYQVKLLGSAHALTAGRLDQKKPSTLYVSDVKQEIHSGDYVVPVNEGQLLPSYFTMRAVADNVHGSIINAASGSREFGKLEVVMINRGMQHQISPGDVMAIKRVSPGVVETNNGPVYTEDAPRWSRILTETNSDYDMPTETLGNIMVFKVYENTSMALILKTSKAVRLQDKVTAP